MRVVVIGAGLQGICAAYYLARAGAEVTVLERNTGPALEASFGNGGLLQVECPEIWNQPGILRSLPKWWWASLGAGQNKAAMLLRSAEMIRLLPWGLRFLRSANTETFQRHAGLIRDLALFTLDCMARLRRDPGVEYAHRACGSLFIFRDSTSLAGYRPLLEYLGARGAEWNALDRNALLDFEPCLRPIGQQLCGAVQFQRDESGNSYRFCQAMSRAAMALGVRFEYRRTVERIATTASGVSVSMSGSGAQVSADAVVLAAGVYSRKLALSLGVRLPIAPAKGYSISMPLGAWQDRPRHVIVDQGIHAGVNVLGDSLRVAGTAEFCGLDSGINPARIDYMLDLVHAVLPEFAAGIDPAAVQRFAGLRPLSADGLPMIGATEAPGVFVNTGHGGLGWTLAAGSAKALADEMQGLAPSLDMAPFSPLRF